MALSGSDHGRPVRGKKSSTRLPFVKKHETEIRSITPINEDKPLHERVASTAPAKIGQPGEGAPRSKTTRSIPRRGAAAGGRSEGDRTKRQVVPAKKSNQLPLILGAGGGGLLLLIIVIAVASSGGTPVRPPEPRKVAPPPPPVVEEVKEDIPDTGWITFICTGGGKHEEKEAVWGRRCPSCDGRAPFLWDDSGANFKCWDCKKIFKKTDVTCLECGKVSFNPRVKPRPR